ncbi:TPA: hypothetical protein J1461_003050, partial [Escherichia coli]|nr:hypothetical protein [Escherichia coli]HBA9621310.1 hypothetical protein [Escherichia coli]
MNKIFKVIWNPATGSYSVASETAKSRGKKSGRSKLLISALVAGGMFSSFGANASASLDGGTFSDPTEITDVWVAIGQGARASSVGNGTGAVAVGANAWATGIGSTALGYQSYATGERSVSIGQVAEASGNRAIAIGSGADGLAEYSVVLGVGAQAATTASNSLVLGKSAKANGADSLALGRQSLASAANSIAIGAETEAAENATAVGTKAKARGKNSLALGANSDSTGEGSVALGYTAAATGASALALGQNAQASNTNTIALGQNSSASTANAIAIGTGSSAVGSNSLALGSSSSAGGNNSVAIGANSTAGEDNVVSVGSGSAQRRIVNMAAGTISTDSKEAINGSQLYAISRSVADRLGGGANVATNGTIMDMSFQLKKKNFNNVGEALQYLDNETLHWDSAKGAFSASYIVKNADGTITSTVAENKIINVKDGDISATSKDAVNGSQLKTTNDNVATNTTNIATNTTNITNLTDSVGDLKDDALLWKGTAFSAAHGTDATSKITNVTAGDLTAGSTDAVNGSQLKTTNDAVAANTTNIATNT